MGCGMADDVLNCPHCQARLRRPPRLEPGTGVMCPRCQTQFAAPTDASARWVGTKPEPRRLIHDPDRLPGWEPRQPLRRVDADDEDYPEPPRRSGRTSNLHLRIVCAIHGLAIVLALGAAFLEVETVVCSGPLISLLGIYVAALGLRRSSRPAVAAGLSAVGFSLFVFLLICGLGWSPGQARVPVRVMGAIYAAVSTSLLAYAALAPGVVGPARDGDAVGRRD
jgi:hypothetical protein